MQGLTRRELLGAAAGTGLALLGAGRASARARRDRPPNVVFVLSDNHRWDALGAMGHPFVKTPHLDRLGREGVHFTNAFCTTPLCSPARASFLTGLYAWRHGVQNHAERSRWDDDQVTFLELLKRHAGHRTAFVGKWHMPGSGLPHLRGVDRFVTFTVQDGQGRYFDCPLVVDGREEASRRAYVTEELTDRALAFVEEAPEEPFCVYLSHKAVHHPWRPAPDLEGIYADAAVSLPEDADSWTGFTNGEIWGGFTRPIGSAIRAYMETVTSLDREMGRLLARLETLGLLDRTLVVYASDNGFLFGEHGHVELRWPFEEALRIPFLVRCPRVVRRPGRRAGQMALNIDLAPTVLDLCGVAVPEHVQGRSLAPVLRDPGAPGRRAFLVENTKEFPYNAPSYRGVRTRRWLYVEYEGRFAPTLHDVASDPGQTRDLIDTPEGRRALPALREMLAALRRGERIESMPERRGERIESMPERRGERIDA
jgi:arylsulfatase A-like enzyme